MVFLPRFGDVGPEGPRDVCSYERVASAEGDMFTVLFLDAGKGGVFPQAGCYLSAVLDCKQPKVAVALLEHKVVCLPYLLWGGMERKPGICQARFGECGVCAVLLAFFCGLCMGEVGGDGLAPGRGGGRQSG